MLRELETTEFRFLDKNLSDLWKSKLGDVSRVIYKFDQKSESEKSERLLFLPIPLTVQWKPGCLSRKQMWKNLQITRPNIEHCDWFIFPRLLPPPLNHMRQSHKQNPYQYQNHSVWLLASLYASDYSSRLDTVALRKPAFWKIHAAKLRGTVASHFFRSVYLRREQRTKSQTDWK